LDARKRGIKKKRKEKKRRRWELEVVVCPNRRAPGNPENFWIFNLQCGTMKEGGVSVPSAGQMGGQLSPPFTT
jgi:hypothetical protein